jgi:hypothetical protein
MKGLRKTSNCACQLCSRHFLNPHCFIEIGRIPGFRSGMKVKWTRIIVQNLERQPGIYILATNYIEISEIGESKAKEKSHHSMA